MYVMNDDLQHLEGESRVLEMVVFVALLLSWVWEVLFRWP